MIDIKNMLIYGFCYIVLYKQCFQNVRRIECNVENNFRNTIDPAKSEYFVFK